jgi:hypothetical protein
MVWTALLDRRKWSHASHHDQQPLPLHQQEQQLRLYVASLRESFCQHFSILQNMTAMKYVFDAGCYSENILYEVYLLSMRPNVEVKAWSDNSFLVHSNFYTVALYEIKSNSESIRTDLSKAVGCLCDNFECGALCIDLDEQYVYAFKVECYSNTCTYTISMISRENIMLPSVRRTDWKKFIHLPPWLLTK